MHRPSRRWLPRRGPFRPVVNPPLAPGLPVVWCPTLVVSALAQLLRVTGYAPRPAWGLLDDLVAPWGLRRVRQTRHFTVPCDCGRTVLRLLLASDMSRWGCVVCFRRPLPRVAIVAARLLFGLRIGLRGEYVTALHLHLARRLFGRMPRMARSFRFQLVQSATVVLSYDPRGTSLYTGPYRAGPVMLRLQSELLDCWLQNWSSPVAYRARCQAELWYPPQHGATT